MRIMFLLFLTIRSCSLAIFALFVLHRCRASLYVYLCGFGCFCCVAAEVNSGGCRCGARWGDVRVRAGLVVRSLRPRAWAGCHRRRARRPRRRPRPSRQERPCCRRVPGLRGSARLETVSETESQDLSIGSKFFLFA